jgi:hypothetical protein
MRYSAVRADCDTKARPTQYAKGPDVASKSARTQQRHKISIHSQTRLETWGFVLQVQKPQNRDDQPDTTSNAQSVTLLMDLDSDDPEMAGTMAQESLHDPCSQSPSPPNTNDDNLQAASASEPDIGITHEDSCVDDSNVEAEEWEAEGEVCETISCRREEI